MLVKTTVERLGHVTIVCPADASMDANNSGEFKREIASVLASSARLVLDLSAVRFLDKSTEFEHLARAIAYAGSRALH